MNRTTHRSTAGTKLYAKRKSGKFTDIQTHRRSSRADQRQTTVEEATRVLVSEARIWRKCIGQLYRYEDVGFFNRKLWVAVNILNTATRAAARKRRAKP